MLDVLDSPVTRLAQEAERRRIARELHDGVVQSLTALVADLEYFRRRCLPTDGETNREVVEKLEVWQELARGSLLSMREALGGLRSQASLDGGLESAVRELLSEFQATGYEVVYDCADWPVTMPLECSLDLYSIVREALTNVRKHAHASKITMFLFVDDRCLHLSIGDDGLGMSSVQARKGSHYGLVGMRERAALLGGQLSIESIPGKGTRVDLAIPLP